MKDDRMDGLDFLGCDDDELGFDYMSLLKGGAGMLSGAGGLMSGGGGGAGGGAAAAAETARLQAEKAAAEASARTWKIVGGVVIGVGALIGVSFLARRPA